MAPYAPHYILFELAKTRKEECMDPWHKVRSLSLAVIVAGIWLGSASAAVDPVRNWNAIAVQGTLTAGENAIVQSRTLAIVQVAIHDTLNAIDSRYERYVFTGNASTETSVEAAIAAAAHDAIVRTIAVGALPFAGFGTSAQQDAAVAQVDAAYTTELAGISDGPPKTAGIARGQAPAAAIL